MATLSNTEDDTRVIVIGGETAKGLAVHMAEARDVRLLSDDEEVVRSTRTDGLDVEHVDLEAGDLQRHADDANLAVVGTEQDRVGLLVTQLLTAICGVDRVIARVNDPKKISAFENLDCETIPTGSLLHTEVERMLTSKHGEI